jgi:hypothetical protein
MSEAEIGAAGIGRWSVREEGNVVIIEITCRDNYEAIELGEVIGQGMALGSLTLEFAAAALRARKG